MSAYTKRSDTALQPTSLICITKPESASYPPYKKRNKTQYASSCHLTVARVADHSIHQKFRLRDDSSGIPAKDWVEMSDMVANAFFASLSERLDEASTVR